MAAATCANKRIFTLMGLLLAGAGTASCKDTVHAVDRGDEQSGDVTVDGGDTVLRFQVRSSQSAAIRVDVTADVPTDQELAPPVEVRVVPDVAYAEATTVDGGGSGAFELTDGTTWRYDLGGEPCKSDCEQDVELHVTRDATSQVPLRVHWVVKAGIQLYVVHDEDAESAYVDVTREN